MSWTSYCWVSSLLWIQFQSCALHVHSPLLKVMVACNISKLMHWSFLPNPINCLTQQSRTGSCKYSRKFVHQTLVFLDLSDLLIMGVLKLAKSIFFSLTSFVCWSILGWTSLICKLSWHDSCLNSLAYWLILALKSFFSSLRPAFSPLNHLSDNWKFFFQQLPRSPRDRLRCRRMSSNHVIYTRIWRIFDILI